NLRRCLRLLVLRVLRNFAQLRHGGINFRRCGSLGPGDYRGFARAHRALVQRGRMMTGNLAMLILLRPALPGLAASEDRPSSSVRWPLFSCVFACLLVAFLPSREALAQAQTNWEQIIKPPKIDKAVPMLLQADEMVYDNENG